jgi:CRISPR/Cas system-associated exonuclease Cas4 (RecB family)
MSEVVHISNSEIQAFKDCRRKWWFTYYRRLQPREKKYTGALALGSRVHEALDQYYATGKPLLQAHADLVNMEKQELLTDFRDVAELEKEAELGHIMLEGYLQWVEENGIDAELEMVSTEEKITMPMFNGEVELQGKIDMRVRRKADGVRMFRDFKTVGGSLSDFANLAPMNEQIMTYMLLEQSKDTETERSEGGIFTMLKKVRRTANARPPFYDQFEVRHNVFTLRSFWDRIHGTVADMMRVRTALDEGENPAFHAYPRPSRDCKWKCQFFTVCTLVDDGSASEQAIEAMFEVADPYAYYGDDIEKKGSE